MKTHPLFRAFLLLLICCSLQTVRGQWVTIPDANFGEWLNTNGYSACLLGDSASGWEMDTTCSAVVNSTSVDCSYKQISDLTGIEYFDNLGHLDCSVNSLVSLPSLPTTLNWLDCSANQLTALPSMPPGLHSLYTSSNQLTSLPTLPSSISTLNCSHNQLTSLQTFSTLVQLWCNHNQLSSLPPLPGNLRILNCTGNQISSIPAWPSQIYRIECGGNLITSLPPLPNTVTYFDCGGNAMGYLPPLSPALEILICRGCQLSNLPPLPVTLRWLRCSNNLLTSLPALPNSLTELQASVNLLTNLPELPDSLAILLVNNNPTLTCLPQLKKVNRLQFYSTGISCLPNYPQDNTISNPSISSIPLCDYFNNNGCDVFWNISGKVFIDENANCLYDTADATKRNMKLNMYENGVLQQQVISTSQGYYSFDVDSYGSFEYTVDTSIIPFSILCPSSGYRTSSITAIDSMDYTMDFALECKPGFDLEARSIVANRFRPANNTTVRIGAGDASNFYGARCAAGVSGAVTITFTGPVSYVSPASGALTPTVSGNTLTYNIADFGLVNFFNDFNFVLVTDTFAQIGQQVCFTVSVTPTTGDNNPANNIRTHCFPIVNSYDPNDKQVYPAGSIDTAQEWLTYTVRFQNTGTAEAQHIYITDTLDSNIDFSSFQLLAYSHQPMVQIVGNAVRFNYPNINLPDSNTNEPLSHGYVQYRVRLHDTLGIGTQIHNTAFIYFDFNAPVITNTVTNTICLPDTSLFAVSICQGDTYSFHGSTLSTSGIYNQAYTNVLGCDSVIQLILTVLPVSGSSISVAICSGENYPFAGTLLNTAGVYYDTLSNSNGCDSVIILNLVVHQFPQIGQHSAGFISVPCSSPPTPISFTNTYQSCVTSLFWDFGNGLSSTLPNPTTVYTNQGLYIVTLIACNGIYCDTTIVDTVFVGGAYLDTFSISQTVACACQDTVHFSLGTIDAVSAILVYGCNAGANLVDSITPRGTFGNPTFIDFDVVYCVTDTCQPQVLLTDVWGCTTFFVFPWLTISSGYSSLTAAICDNEEYIFNGRTLNTAGVYYDTLQNVLGCDSVVELTLTVISPSVTTISDGFCHGETYSFGGQLLNAAGNYTDTLTNVNGCDSIVQLILTVVSPSVTNISDGLCPGETYSFGGQLLNAAGNYTDTLTNVNGCDSVVQLSLALLSIDVTTIDTAITQGSVYTLPSGVTVNIAGTYVDTLVGSNACDSIVTVNLSVVSGVSESETNPIFEMFPNPAHEVVSVIVDEPLVGAVLTVIDITGRVMQALNVEHLVLNIEVKDLSSGIYFVTITNKGRNSVKRLAVQK